MKVSTTHNTPAPDSAVNAIQMAAKKSSEVIN